MIVLAVTGFAVAGFYGVYGYVRAQGDQTTMNAEAKKLNDAVTIYLNGGGSLTVSDTATSVLAKIQTPVDTNTFHALQTVTAIVPATYDLQAYSVADGRARLTWTGTAYAVGTTGAGFRPVTLSTPKTLTAQTIATSGETFATTSHWVWDFTNPAPAGANNPAGLVITGPQSITTPGTYTWTLTSTISGPLTMRLQNNQFFNGVGTTLNESQSFTYGANFTFAVLGSYVPADATSAKTITYPVTVNIPVVALAVIYAREDGTTSTGFTYAQVTATSGPPATRDGIVLSVAGNPSGVSVYYTYDGTDPTAASNLYTGPFNVPLAAWSGSVPFKAVAIPSGEGSVSGPILSLTLTPTQTQLGAPSFNPSPSGTVAQGSSITVVPNNATTGSPRTVVGDLPLSPPTASSSNATSVPLPNN
jgi:hypothetical protein